MNGESDLDGTDRRLIAALQLSARVGVERLATVLGTSPRVVTQRLNRLLAGGAIRLTVTEPPTATEGVLLLRIRVLRGTVDAVARALAEREDITFLDISAGGDELQAVLMPTPESGSDNNLVFRRLPATRQVIDVDAQTVLHVFADASGWRLAALTDDERRQLGGPTRDHSGTSDDTDQIIAAALAQDVRRPISAIARDTDLPESTVRRRLTRMFADGRLSTHVEVDPHRLGLRVDANLRLHVTPGSLDSIGRTLARHPAVHGAFATTGRGNLHVAVWLPTLEDLYQFITNDLADPGITAIDTMLVGRATKRTP